MKYMCNCGKVFENLADAEKCETKHEEEKAKREQLNAERKEREDEIKRIYLELEKKIDEFNKDYPSGMSAHEFPYSTILEYFLR